MSHLLLIEDDTLLGEGLRQFLEQQGFECTWLAESNKVDKHWFHADLVILDRQLADGDSLAHLPHWLSLKAVPVIVLTAKIEVEQRVEGLMAGAKDYVVKPFSHQELLARIYAQLRPLGESQLVYGQIKVEPGSRHVYWQDQDVTLKPKEFDLLLLLLQNQGRVFHREELLNKIWGYQAFPTTRTVDNHVLRLRQKLPGLAIETHRGVGYRLVVL
ncbi:MULTISPECIES: response regulator transcription factor [unclassified Salinivibrio]|uniref:response regulator transcription factor n=1 Tax=unclassified Salinivibrio TaxID=2636825 RepID=UPI00098578E5|nr:MULTISPECIES: response regulator transcription factor [unclassified Salinivibrio]MPS31954.1 DNA-binding response regulator [Salinivibrio sp. VYel7]MPX89761.1 response regulator transcription factor [Salinivibrio sp. VYel1]MPX93348.1 response regulator transcription factor [Salinivibrio sp. VYel9]MPX95825.1 response regulator transcription factor [Salinivibrio sp. VYel6]MPX99566.1 response regulator transcription factor [Salinivibrio sp. VYel4]